MESLIEIPQYYLCPITQKLMTDPIIVADGGIYEREAFALWLQRGNRMSPATGRPMADKTCIENWPLKESIDEFIERFPGTQRQEQTQASLEEAVKFREQLIDEHLEKRDSEIERLRYENELYRRTLMMMESNLVECSKSFNILMRIRDEKLHKEREQNKVFSR